MNGESSKWYSVDSKVPQGSVLGTLLFILYYVNDIPDIVDSKITMFADDIKIYATKLVLGKHLLSRMTWTSYVIGQRSG